MSGNERFWTVVLYVVTVSYVAFCCLILGWLAATEGSFIEALVTMGGAYGTLLTGVPVLIAVVVAKQQLDANRRQHVATVKRSFKEQLDAIDEVRSFSRRIRTFPRENIVSILSKYDHIGDHLFTMPSHVGMQITPLVSNNIMTSVHRMNKILYSLTPGLSPGDQDVIYCEIINYCDVLESLIEREYSDLAKYWS